MRQEEWTEHTRTYTWFVRGVILFAAHALVILFILAWMFADEMGAVAFTG
jgi:hypothetical protein